MTDIYSTSTYPEESKEWLFPVNGILQYASLGRDQLFNKCFPKFKRFQTHHLKYFWIVRIPSLCILRNILFWNGSKTPVIATTIFVYCSLLVAIIHRYQHLKKTIFTRSDNWWKLNFIDDNFDIFSEEIFSSWATFWNLSRANECPTSYNF